MRAGLLGGCLLVAIIVFAIMMCAVHEQCSAQARTNATHPLGRLEYLWALIPWAMMAACVYPAVRLILLG